MRIGTLFINVLASSEETSLISLKLVYSEEKTKSELAIAGKHG